MALKGLYHKREFQIILINHCRRFHQTWFHSLTFVWVQTSPKGRKPLGVLACKCLGTMVISVNNKLLLALHTVSSTARGSYRHFFKFPSWLKVKVNYYVLHSAPAEKKWILYVRTNLKSTRKALTCLGMSTCPSVLLCKLSFCLWIKINPRMIVPLWFFLFSCLKTTRVVFGN